MATPIASGPKLALRLPVCVIGARPRKGAGLVSALIMALAMVTPIQNFAQRLPQQCPSRYHGCPL
jgi:hypothetical protein